MAIPEILVDDFVSVLIIAQAEKLVIYFRK